jgi:hypothetical protein
VPLRRTHSPSAPGRCDHGRRSRRVPPPRARRPPRRRLRPSPRRPPRRWPRPARCAW